MTAIGRIFFKNKTIIATDSLSEHDLTVKKHLEDKFPKNPLSGHCGKFDFYPHLQCVMTHTGSSMLPHLVRLFLDRHRTTTNIDELIMLIEGPEFNQFLKKNNYVKSLSSEHGFIGLLTLHGISETIAVKIPDSNEFIRTKRDNSELIAKQYYVGKDGVKSMTLYDVHANQQSAYHIDFCCESFTRDDEQILKNKYQNKIAANSMQNNNLLLIDFMKVCHQKGLGSLREKVSVGGQVFFAILENTDGILSTTHYVGYTFPDFKDNLIEIKKIQDYENSIVDVK